MKSDKKTLRDIAHELVDHPFFPILFIGEFVKKVVEGSPTVPEFGVLAVVATVFWVFSDVFDAKTIKQDIIGLEDKQDKD